MSTVQHMLGSIVHAERSDAHSSASIKQNDIVGMTLQSTSVNNCCSSL